MTPQQVTVGPPPLPGGVAAVLRFFFNLPRWFQIAGFIAGVVVAAVVVVLLWRSRTAVVQWLVARPRGVKLGLGAAAAVVVLVFAATGAVGFHYIEHDNGFCTGCHVMKEPFQRFAGSKHDALECHNCHQQSMIASMRQLYLWVAERPEQIGKHAKVPTRVCANCHVRGDAKETWQRIASTAGHRTHLESDSSALKNVQCVTCHGFEVHRFVPVDSTCAQAGCHVSVQIKLAKMRGQTDLHCVMCHRFTADVPALATHDSARGTLVPNVKQCFSCHQMHAVLAEFDPARDPHRGTCGMCHNPHRQARPQEAAATCSNAGCHAGWRAEPFHLGKRHRNVVRECTLCHLPHAAKVDPSDCAGCHEAVRERRAGKHLTPQLPFDTTRALRRVSWAREPPAEPRTHGPSPDDPSPTARDTFPHDRHQSYTCITCHTSKQEHGRLTFQPPRGCQICHHEAAATLDCSRCHAPGELDKPEAVRINVAVAGAPVRAHPARFDHATHRGKPCTECHTTAVTLAPAAAVASCTACHDDHHAQGRRCAACHTDGSTQPVKAAHAPPAEGHVACDACHVASIVAKVAPDRALCLTCHAAREDHYAAAECTVCHFQAPPDVFQAHLRKAAGS